MKPTIDYSVVERFKAGDELAYDEIYNAYRNTVYFMAYNYFHDSGMAEDIVQDTFISLLKYIDKIDSIEGLGLYIRKICYHRSMDKLRRKKLNTIEDTEEYTVEDRTDNKELVASATDHEINDAIMDSLGRLDFDLKSVGILRFYEQLSIDDIAEILTIPAGTVKSRINRLRTILQEDLTKVGVTPEMYRSALSTGGLALIYQTMSSTALQKAMGAVTPLKSHSNKGKSTTITAISAVVVCGCAIGLGLNRDNIHSALASKDNSACTISTIAYDKNITNKDLPLTVNLSSKDYDEVLVNGSSNTTISSNGSYTVTVVKDNKTLDSQKIEVTNIDKDNPIVNKTVSGKEVSLTFSDTGSGLDTSSLHFYKNGVEDSSYSNSSSISFTFENGNTYKATISDKAGNVVMVDIK